MSAAATQKVYTGVPAREVDQLSRFMQANGASSVVSVPGPTHDLMTVIATLEPGRTDFKTVGEYTDDVAAKIGA